MDANNDDNFHLVPPGGDEIPPENSQPSQPSPNNPPDQSSLIAQLLVRIQELEGQVKKSSESQQSPTKGGSSEASISKKPTISYKVFLSCAPPKYEGSDDPIITFSWIREMEQTFTSCDCDEEHKVPYAVRQLKGRALIWWNSIKVAMPKGKADKLGWEAFLELFQKEFCT
ncbi:hypothetical protein OSB04_un001201 [Centaurea solstitialis]|nr:hypothetical protein OSB04_un001201 [Centaurea solstitialis]